MRRSALVLLALSALASLTYGVFARDWVLNDAPTWARVALKTAPVALLAITSIVERGRVWLTTALALGALGDALLAIGPGLWFVAGGAAFFAGHIFYIMLFLSAGVGIGAVLKAPLRALGALAILACATVNLALLWPGDDPAAWAPTLLYTLAVTSMALSALTLPASAALAIAGGVLFLVSDILLSWLIQTPPADPGPKRLLSDTGWFTYYFGQAGLCLGALALRLRT